VTGATLAGAAGDRVTSGADVAGDATGDAAGGTVADDDDGAGVGAGRVVDTQAATSARATSARTRVCGG